MTGRRVGGDRHRSTRQLKLVGWVVVLLFAAAAAGCDGSTPERAVPQIPDSTGRPTQTLPDHGSVTSGVAPNPPATYAPAWPRETVKNRDGYLVDACVPRRLRDKAIALTDADGVHLSGLVLGSGTDGVLLSHEQGYSVCSFLDLAERLAADGYQVLLPEYRNHGASQRTPDNVHIDRDARAGLRELERRGAKRIFVGGASCGGTTSGLVARDVRNLVGVLNMSSPVRCGQLNSIPAFRNLTVPSLFVVSPGDMQGAVEEQVREGYAASASDKKRLIVNGSGLHGTDMFRDWEHGPRLERTVERFIVGCFNATS